VPRDHRKLNRTFLPAKPGEGEFGQVSDCTGVCQCARLACVVCAHVLGGFRCAPACVVCAHVLGGFRYPCLRRESTIVRIALSRMN
jgi:hypothetical protein